MPGSRTSTTQCPVGIPSKTSDRYEGLKIDAGLRLDLIVAEQVIVEVKAVERMIPIYDDQLLTYLKLTNLRPGLLINFNVPLIKDGIKRIIL
ncbi:MAG TPA: GxxExxY protein [Pyrinomonadaceae bacterium]|nr:GxxExxY protein [Pyrinomonadaceae bacterium]